MRWSAWIVLALLPRVALGVVHVEIRSGGELVAGKVVAVRAGEPEPARITTTANGTVTLDLESGDWIIKAAVAGYWSSSEALKQLESREERTATLTLWRSGTLSGRVKALAGVELPAKLDLSFSASPSDKSGLPEASVSCPVTEGHWLCQLPAGNLDVYLGAPGFIRQYFWNVAVSVDKQKELASIVHLRRGAAVRGWVITEDGADVVGANVDVVPRATLEEDPSRGRLKKYSGSVTDRGFFQIEDIAPGAYVATASKTGYAPARASVRVLDNRTTVVDDPPLTLRTARALELYVDPPAPPMGGTWTAHLKQIDNYGESLAEAFTGDVPPGQAWNIENVPDGRYFLTIRTTEDKETPGVGTPAWFTEAIEVRSETTQVFVTVPAIIVSGHVELGGEPLPAELSFGGRFNATRHTFTTDEDGEFSGWLGRPGLWEIDIRAKELLIDTRVQREIEDGDDLEFIIPDTRVKGRVVTEQGMPAAGAIVRIRSLQRPVQKSADADQTGHFEAVGMPEGPISLKAEQGRYLTSNVQQTVLEDGAEAPEVVLVLREIVRRTGRVIAPNGVGVPGAHVIALVVEDAPVQLSPVYAADEQGRFEMELSAQAQNLVMTIAAPGFAFRMLRAAIGQGEIVLPLSQESGTLTIEVPTSIDSRRWSSPLPVVRHNGSFTVVRQLARWAAINGQPQESPNVTVVPFMEPGHYSACWIAQGNHGALLTGTEGPLICESGELAASGVLTLVLPDPDRQ